MNNTGYTGETDAATGSGHEQDRGRAASGTRRRTSGARPAPVAGRIQVDVPVFAFDAMSLLRPALRRWYWLVIAGIVGVAAGAYLGLRTWQPSYTATAQILAVTPPVASDAYQPQKMSGVTLVGMISSPEVYKQLGEKMDPPMSGGQLAHRINIIPERLSDIVGVAAGGATPEAAVDLANRYIREVVTFMQEYQRKEAEEADVYVAQEIKETEAELAASRKNAPAALAFSPVDAADAPLPEVVVDRVAEKMQVAKDELATLLLTYTDMHPRVKQKRSEIAALEAQVPEHILNDVRFTAPRPTATPRAAGAPAAQPIGRTNEDELAFYQARTREQYQQQLVNRQRAIQVFKSNPPGNFRVMQPPRADNVVAHSPTLKIGLLAVFFGMLGIVLASAELVRRELFDNRLKTEADVKRVTGLPVLATLGDMKSMSVAEQENWAFRTWIALQDRLAYSPNHGLICGITSSDAGDGRSTWISLLAGAARKCGFRVLTIATQPSTTAAAEEPSRARASAVPEPATVGVHAEDGAPNGHRPNGAYVDEQPARTATETSREMTKGGMFAGASRDFAGESDFTSLTASALFTPAMVTEKLTGPETDPLVHIPLPGWTWNLERRRQWQGALNVWRKIDNVVILVELPPASMPESVLLASNLPNLVWLVESGKSDATTTRTQLDTLQHARCNLVGAVINRAFKPMSEGRFSRWVGCLAMFSLLGLLSPGLFAADVNRPTAAAMEAPARFSIVSPAQRAAWQQKLTLGPGDILNLSLYGEPVLTAQEVPIGPDGRVGYLEAQNVMAAGLTVDEFRERLNEELGKFRRSPQAYVVPVAYNSKKYFVLGKVTQSGVFTLDRPMTLIEAVAQARGMETGIGADRSLVELADLSRSFIARSGRHLPVDFEKLFLQGDLSQNVALEPDDYIYFPSQSQKEVYVLGAVTTPGPYVYTSTTGALGAIAARGGFTLRAWKNRVLVIRGSLGQPETFIIDATDVLTAHTADLKLQPKDIVFVSDRPWARAEELLDAAAAAFVTSAVVVWTGLHVR